MKTPEFMIAAAGFAFVSGAGAASAYTPKWLQCDGQVVVTGEDAGTKPAHDIYVTDDDNKNLFVYLQAKGTQALEPVKTYNDNEITWSMGSRGINNARWDGRIDRKTLALHLDYSDTGTTRVWTEQCKPTNPMKEGGVSADAGAAKGSAASGKKSG